MSHVKFRVRIEQDEDGVFVAEVPALPGCISQGETRDDALANAEEAIVLYIESLEAHGEPIPLACSVGWLLKALPSKHVLTRG